MKCKNCGHEILFFVNWYHIAGYVLRADEEPNAEIRMNKRCRWKNKQVCKTCDNVSFTEPCTCSNPEPEVRKE